MNRLIRKTACVVMAITLITGAFTACRKPRTEVNETEAALPSFTSVRDDSGNLSPDGTVGDMEYRIMGQDQYGCYNQGRGYYIDTLDQPDSPYFIVVSAGIPEREGGELTITDLGMQDSTLVIVVEEKEATGAKTDELDCPCAVLEVDHMPSDLVVVSTTGEQFESLFE
ncbi:MAG: hypothetical protein IJ869_03585 [Clostridiales bacterium]|nr:hypothetical protein [Clostridiales bacterium]